jgi:RNA polymerase sigma factor (sigma-70 family)
MTKHEINELIVRHIDFSEKIARLNCKKYPAISFDELVSAAYMGLVIAANKYKLNRKTKFTTYAYLKINFSIRIYAKENYPSRSRVKPFLHEQIDRSMMESIPCKNKNSDESEIVEALTQGLNQKEKEIFLDYYLNGKRLSEIAVEKMVDKSKISRIFEDINKKLALKWEYRKFELYSMIS